MVGASEGAEALRQSKRFVESVSGPVTERVFTVKEGADAHCQMGNLPVSNAVVFDWLGELFAA